MVLERDGVLVGSRPVNQKCIMRNNGNSIRWIEHTVRSVDQAYLGNRYDLLRLEHK